MHGCVDRSLAKLTNDKTPVMRTNVGFKLGLAHFNSVKSNNVFFFFLNRMAERSVKCADHIRSPLVRAATDFKLLSLHPASWVAKISSMDSAQTRKQRLYYVLCGRCGR